MSFSKWMVFAGFQSALLCAGTSQAIEVFPIVKEIHQDTPRDNYVTVKSSFALKEGPTENNESPASQKYEFVTLELYKVTNPGETQEKREKELGSANPTLLYSPTRLVVPYGDERRVRIMPLRAVAYEQIYRLRIRPSYPEQELDKGKVRFAVGYDVLLRYLPAGKPVQGLSISCQNDQWTLTATGNVRSELRDLVIDGKAPVQSFNVYPKNSRTLTVHQQLSYKMQGQTHSWRQCREGV